MDVPSPAMYYDACASNYFEFIETRSLGCTRKHTFALTNEKPVNFYGYTESYLLRRGRLPNCVRLNFRHGILAMVSFRYGMLHIFANSDGWSYDPPEDSVQSATAYPTSLARLATWIQSRLV